MKFTRSKKQEAPSRAPIRTKSSPKIHAYYTPHTTDGVKTDHHQKRGTQVKALKKHSLQRVLLVFVGLFIVGAASILSKEPIISVRGDHIAVSVDRYSAATLGLLESSTLNTNKFTLQDEKIESSLREQFPEIEAVDVSYMVFGRKPTVNITTRDLPITLTVGAKVYAVTQNGQIAGEKSQFPLLQKAITVRDDSGVAISQGDTIFRSDDVLYLEKLVSILKAKNRGVEYIKMTSIPREIFVKTTDKRYEVRLFLDDDVSQQVGSWFAVEKVVGEQGGEGPTQYIDVRAGEKVFWL